LSRAINTLQDLRNSRLLFTRWRQEIKQELSDLWRQLLAKGPKAYADTLNGELASDFLKTPHLASRIIAEAMLRREEGHWARVLDNTEPHADNSQSLSAYGLRYSPSHHGYLLSPSAELIFTGLKYARNLYVCGHRIDDLSLPLIVTIHVNDVHKKTVIIEAERHINVGIINPILLPGIANCFRIEVSFENMHELRHKPAYESIVLTHVVVDDQVLDF
jgi:hypothetical protein